MARIINFGEFHHTLREALIANSFGLGGIIAGLVITLNLNILNSTFFPWAIALFPAVLSAKGVISGLFSGSLSTSLHVGTIHPYFIGNTKKFYTLYQAVIVITLEVSIAIGLVSTVFSSFFWQITLLDVLNILIVIMATMTMGLSLSLFTITFTFTTFKKGLDPDVIVYPIMSTIMDIAVTIFYIIMITLFFTSGIIGKYVVVIVGLLPLALSFYIIPRNMHDQGFLHMIKESFLTVILVAFIVNVAGIVLKNISNTLIAQNRREIYTVYPALTAIIGNVGSMVGSVATTKLALGLLKPSLRAIRTFFSQIIATWFSSILFFILLSFLSLFMNNMLVLAKFINFVSLLFIVNIIAVGIIVLFSYGISFLTFKWGLDPDNFVIPIESSLADTITSIALLWALYWMF